MDNIDNADERREKRRKRRIRNRLLSILVVILFVAAIAGGSVSIYFAVSARQAEKQHEDEIASALEELTENETETPVITEPEVPEVVTDALDEYVDGKIAEMPLEDKVAGLFFITPEALTGVNTATQAGNGTQTALSEHAVGGLIYFKKNITSESQIAEMLEKTQSFSKYELFFGVNEEGGSVSSVASSLKVDDVATAAELGSAGDPGTAYSAGYTIGIYLKDLGFNVDFAPVADVKTDAANTLLGDRSFGSDALVVGEMAASMVSGIQDVGISACVKSFPGMGSASADPAVELSTTERTLDEMRATEFVAFQTTIDMGTQFVMVSNVAAPSILGDYTPCSMSKDMITDTLRGELGFDGIVITAPLNEMAITEYYTSAEVSVNAIKAGADMILMPENFEEAYNALLTAVQDGTISEERINESLHRIYRVKYADEVTM